MTQATMTLTPQQPRHIPDHVTARQPGQKMTLPAVPTDKMTPQRSAEIVEMYSLGGADREAAIVELYKHYEQTVLRFIRYRVRNEPLTEDLASEVWCRVLKRLGTWRDMGTSLGAWIITIAAHIIADYFKSGRYRLEMTAAAPPDMALEAFGMPMCSPVAPQPEEFAVAASTNRQLAAMVKALNPDQLKCIELRFGQRLSTAETAKQMGRSEGAIKALQCRAIKRLRDKLEKLGWNNWQGMVDFAEPAAG